jgi:hypothetical protein
MAALRAIGFGAALGLTAALPAAAQEVVDLFGVEQATLEWAPASGAVAGYYVIVSRNGGEPSLYGVSNDTREAVTSPIGDTVTVQVAAFDAAGLAGPISAPSSALRFNPLPPPPTDSGGTSTDPGTDPGDGGGTGGDGSTPETPIGGAVRFDFTGDGRSDLLLRDPTSGEVELWVLQGTQVVKRSALPHLPYPWYLEATGDYDGDGTVDLLWRHETSGQLSIWMVREGAVTGGGALEVAGMNLTRSWKVGGSADFDGNGIHDIVLTYPTKGVVKILTMDAAGVASIVPRTAPTPDWRVGATPDADGDGRAEILWENQKNRALSLEWLDTPGQSVPLVNPVSGWRLRGSADIDGDGRDDLLVRNPDTREVRAWLLDGAHVTPTAWSTKPGDKTWRYKGFGDFDGDGRADSFWHHPDGFVEIWFAADAGVAPAFVSDQTAGDKVVGEEGD